MRNSNSKRGIFIIAMLTIIFLFLLLVAAGQKRNQMAGRIMVESDAAGKADSMQLQIAKAVQEQQVALCQQRFKNAVFLGDSLTEGLALYGYVKMDNVIAQKGLSLEKAQKKIAKIQKKNPKYIFIMLGINDLNYSNYSMNDVEHNYGKLLRKLHKKLPDSRIYVQSLLPVTAKYERSNKRLRNKRIQTFNRHLQADIKQYDYVSYTDISHLYKNAKGKLPAKKSSDGYHLKAAAYQKWVDYVKNRIRE